MLFFVLLITIGLVRSGTFTLPFRQFSISPSLSGVGTTDNLASNYGAGQFFVDYVKSYTSALAPAGSQTVTFVPQGVSWQPAAGCSVIQQVGQKTGCVNASRNATMDAGSQLNPVWGFMYNSGPAFGPNFPDFFQFLSSPTGAGNESGLELLQRILDSRNAGVQIIPAVGSPRQASGYLQLDANVVGLSEICKAGWVWRYLPPNQQILDMACSNLVGAEKQMTFVNSVGGLGPAVDVQKGLVTAFEYAAAIDNYDARTGGFFPLNGSQVLCSPSNPLPACAKVNPGHLGLRYVHYPGWQQNWFVAWMYLSKDVWNGFSAEQQVAIRDAGFNSMYDSWQASGDIECLYTQRILAINDNEIQLNTDGTPKDCNAKKDGLQTCSADMLLTQWKPNDITVLQTAAQQYLDSLAGTSANQLDFAVILNKYQAFETEIGWTWKREQFPRGCNSAKARK
jgi:hypothetical protein